MCLYPRLIKNKKYTANKKNGGQPPPVLDDRTRYVPIGCQNCLECRKLKAREWQARMTEEIKINKNGQFVTLTFSQESIIELLKDIPDQAEGYELDNAIAIKATRLFLERWRKEHKKSVRHWLVTELGHNNTERVHLHGIIWTDNKEDIKRIWKYGYVFIGDYVSKRTVNYIIKYVTKIDEKHKGFKSKILTSPGIGSQYVKSSNAATNKYKQGDTKETYRTETGTKIGLPIYWRNKIYSEQEREKLWIEKIEKGTRYVLGQKIEVKDGIKKYNDLLEIAQEKNKRLGYGNDEKDWTKEQYDRELKNMKNAKKKNKQI